MSYDVINSEVSLNKIYSCPKDPSLTLIHLVSEDSRVDIKVLLRERNVYVCHMPDRSQNFIPKNPLVWDVFVTMRKMCVFVVVDNYDFLYSYSEPSIAYERGRF